LDDAEQSLAIRGLCNLMAPVTDLGPMVGALHSFPHLVASDPEGNALVEAHYYVGAQPQLI
jgi:hypothetical protein